MTPTGGRNRVGDVGAPPHPPRPNELEITMLAWIRRSERKRGAWLPLTVLLVACASVLGIEDRQQDSAASYPAQGYEGCRPGGSCSGCLAVHQRECEVRGACSAAATTDDCAGCVCENCLEPVIDCQLDAGCSVIWQCLKQSRCDLSEGASGSCVDACAGVIDTHGGVRGAAFRAAAEIRTCAVTSSCLSCLAPEPEPPPGCSQANACQDCPDCFRQCLCSGEKFGKCKELCGADAPAATCTPENSCGGCSNCFELCTCGGAGYEPCTSACQGTPPNDPPVTQCTLATDCTDCTDCMATCACGGFALARCESECAPPSPDDVCVDLSDHGQTCDGCSGCISECTCEGDSLEQCMDSCRVLECCDQSCSGAMTTCSCDASNSADFCGQQYYDCSNASACSACACRNCPGKYALCQETLDCPAVFECMRSTHCQGSACQERCGSVGTAAGGSGDAFDVAEALWACDQANFCACETPAEETLLCPGPAGDVTCSDYEGGNNALLPACCPSTAGSGGNRSACGLDLRRYVQNARECESLSQGNGPRALLETCPARTIFEPPYNGAQLSGCCNSAANTCGVYDDITGLGCLKNSVFGVQPQGCGLL
jgi:hypothetical protein